MVDGGWAVVTVCGAIGENRSALPPYKYHKTTNPASLMMQPCLPVYFNAMYADTTPLLTEETRLDQSRRSF